MIRDKMEVRFSREGEKDMVRRHRIRDIEETLGLDTRKALKRDVRKYIAFIYGRVDGLPPKRWPATRVCWTTKTEIVGVNHHHLDLDLVEAVRMGGDRLRERIQSYADCIREGGYPLCIEVREPAKKCLIVCSNKDWARVHDVRECFGCRSFRKIYDLDKKGRIVRVLIETTYRDLTVPRDDDLDWSPKQPASI